jgi:DNA-binding winged helix-turn-helix (wHTH) protein
VPETRAWRERPPFRIGEFEARPASNEIVVAGTVVRLKPRLMDVLLRLAAAPGEVVSRETLLAEAWPRRMVNDDVLSRAIADLRSTLRDDAREARFIETLPKVGYRLIAAVSPIEEAAITVALPRPREHRHWIAAAAAGALAAVVLLYLLRPATVAPPDRDELTRQLANAEPFSSDVDLEIAPRFSPDGARIAFAAGVGRRSLIVLKEVRTGARTTLGDPGDLNLSPVFFPDGKRLAFYRRTPAGDCEIVAYDLATHVRERLVDCTRRPQPRFDLSPDGKTLAYVGVVRPEFPAGLVARSLANGDERVLTTPEPDSGDDLFPRFSPDSVRIAFFRGNDSHRELWMLDIANPERAKAAGSPRGLVYGAAWLGTQGPLLVAADWFGQRSLNVFDPLGGGASSVGARGARFPDADRAGNVVYENAIYSANLFMIEPGAPQAAPRELWASTRYTNQAEYSPDGARVLFVSNRDGIAGIYVAAVDGKPERLPLPDDYVYLRPHWSHDGTAIYAIRASRREDGGRVQQAIRIGVADGKVEVLARLGDSVFDVRQTSDGKQWIVGELTGNTARLLRHDRLDAPGQRLPLPLASEYQIAGGRLAFQQPQLSGLTLCELATLKCEPLQLPIGEANRFDWLLTADAVWYLALGSPNELVRYDLGKRAVGWRGAFAPNALGLSIAVRPDGGAVLVAREAAPAIDLMYAPRR